MSTTLATKTDLLKLFGEIDRQANGSISSEYPAWMNRVHINNLKEEVGKIEINLERNRIPHDKVYYEKEKLMMLKTKLENIDRSKPHLSDGEKGRLEKMYQYLGETISELMPTRTENLKGLFNTHKELECMQRPCIKVPEEFVSYVLASNITVLDGKISRNQAAKVWKIIGNLLDRHTNVEYLRKD